MILVPIVALALGALLALLINLGGIGANAGQYFAVACLAGFDTICGGIRGALEVKFRTDVFVTGFVSNVVIACFLTWIGEFLSLPLYLAVAIVLGTRIYTNLSLIRRFVMTRIFDARERQRLKDLAAQQQSAQAEPNP